ncbi:TDT family transporter [Streptococcus iniae]|uniref:TDT family transporter n=1 Tax=Streptococcus iniae TaxID=1346 RepID=UPI001CD46A8F|nr:TDT family transporter [Streptococcus iniae]MCA1358342.1 TDT family transporter [Streptococcus iniae]
MRHYQNPPLVFSGLILGTMALGNLLAGFLPAVKWLTIPLALIMYSLLIMGIIRHPKEALNQLKMPIVASVFPTFFMVGMLFASFLIQSGWALVGTVFWWMNLISNLILIAYYLNRFVFAFKWENVYPSWTVLFVGVAMSSLTAPASKAFTLGQVVFWICLVMTIIIFPILLKKTYQIGLPDAFLPNISTFCAPLSLLLAGYLSTFPHPKTSMVVFLLFSSQTLYVFVIWQLPKLLKRPFTPGFSAFTFPYVISATSLKMALSFLGIKGLVSLLVYAELAIALVLVTYVLVLYIRFLQSQKTVGS